MRVAASSRPDATKVASVSPPERGTITTLRGKTEFDRVFESGRRRRIGGIVAILSAGRPDAFRYGLVVGRKVGGAVERNRIKRRIRHAIAEVSPPPGTDAVVIASREVGRVEFTELVGWLSDAFGARAEER